MSKFFGCYFSMLVYVYVLISYWYVLTCKSGYSMRELSIGSLMSFIKSGWCLTYYSIWSAILKLAFFPKYYSFDSDGMWFFLINLVEEISSDKLVFNFEEDKFKLVLS